MTLILRNVLITVARPTYTPGQGTTPAQPHLTNIPAHIMPVHENRYDPIGNSALRIEYYFKVDSGVDIQYGDLLTRITLLDGVTDWPASLGNNEMWTVIIAVEHTPGIMAYRELYVGRYVLGGPVPK